METYDKLQPQLRDVLLKLIPESELQDLETYSKIPSSLKGKGKQQNSKIPPWSIRKNRKTNMQIQTPLSGSTSTLAATTSSEANSSVLPAKSTSQKDLTVWTAHLMKILTTCFAQHRWHDGAKLLYAITHDIRHTSEVVWKAGFQILCNHPKSTPDLLKQFAMGVLQLKNVFKPAIVLEWIMYFLNRGKICEAREVLEHVKSYRTQRAMSSYTEKQKHVALILQGYEGLLKFAEWTQLLEEISGSSAIEPNQQAAMANDMKLDRLASQAIEVFEELFRIEGNWDIFVTKYIDLMKFHCKYDHARTVLLRYCQVNPNNPNSFIFAYDFLKEHFPQQKSTLRLVLKGLALVCPSDKRVLELPGLLSYRDNNVELEAVFKLLDYDTWRNDPKPWKKLASIVANMHRIPIPSEFKLLGQLWHGRVSWWPKYHFRLDQVVAHTDLSAELLVNKAMVLAMLGGIVHPYIEKVREVVTESPYSELLSALDDVEALVKNLDANSSTDGSDDSIVYPHSGQSQYPPSTSNSEHITRKILTRSSHLQPKERTKHKNAAGTSHYSLRQSAAEHSNVIPTVEDFVDVVTISEETKSPLTYSKILQQSNSSSNRLSNSSDFLSCESICSNNYFSAVSPTEHDTTPSTNSTSFFYSKTKHVNSLKVQSVTTKHTSGSTHSKYNGQTKPSKNLSSITRIPPQLKQLRKHVNGDSQSKDITVSSTPLISKFRSSLADKLALNHQESSKKQTNKSDSIAVPSTSYSALHSQTATSSSSSSTRQHIINDSSEKSLVSSRMTGISPVKLNGSTSPSLSSHTSKTVIKPNRSSTLEQSQVASQVISSNDEVEQIRELAHQKSSSGMFSNSPLISNMPDSKKAVQPKDASALHNANDESDLRNTSLKTLTMSPSRLLYSEASPFISQKKFNSPTSHLSMTVSVVTSLPPVAQNPKVSKLLKIRKLSLQNRKQAVELQDSSKVLDKPNSLQSNAPNKLFDSLSSHSAQIIVSRQLISNTSSNDAGENASHSLIVQAEAVKSPKSIPGADSKFKDAPHCDTSEVMPADCTANVSGESNSLQLFLTDSSEVVETAVTKDVTDLSQVPSVCASEKTKQPLWSPSRSSFSQSQIASNDVLPFSNVSDTTGLPVAIYDSFLEADEQTLTQAVLAVSEFSFSDNDTSDMVYDLAKVHAMLDKNINEDSLSRFTDASEKSETSNESAEIAYLQLSGTHTNQKQHSPFSKESTNIFVTAKLKQQCENDSAATCISTNKLFSTAKRPETNTDSEESTNGSKEYGSLKRTSLSDKAKKSYPLVKKKGKLSKDNEMLSSHNKRDKAQKERRVKKNKAKNLSQPETYTKKLTKKTAKVVCDNSDNFNESEQENALVSDSDAFDVDSNVNPFQSVPSSKSSCFTEKKQESLTSNLIPDTDCWLEAEFITNISEQVGDMEKLPKPEESVVDGDDDTSPSISGHSSDTKLGLGKSTKKNFKSKKAVVVENKEQINVARVDRRSGNSWSESSSTDSDCATKDKEPKHKAKSKSRKKDKYKFVNSYVGNENIDNSSSNDNISSSEKTWIMSKESFNDSPSERSLELESDETCSERSLAKGAHNEVLLKLMDVSSPTVDKKVGKCKKRNSIPSCDEEQELKPKDDEYDVLNTQDDTAQVSMSNERNHSPHLETCNDGENVLVLSNKKPTVLVSSCSNADSVSSEVLDQTTCILHSDSTNMPHATQKTKKPKNNAVEKLSEVTSSSRYMIKGPEFSKTKDRSTATSLRQHKRSRNLSVTGVSIANRYSKEELQKSTINSCSSNSNESNFSSSEEQQQMSKTPLELNNKVAQQKKHESSESEVDDVGEKFGAVSHNEEETKLVRNVPKNHRDNTVDRNTPDMFNGSQESNCWFNAELVESEVFDRTTKATDSGPADIPRATQKAEKSRNKAVQKASQLKRSKNKMQEEHAEFSEVEVMSSADENWVVEGSFERASNVKINFVCENSNTHFSNDVGLLKSPVCPGISTSVEENVGISEEIQDMSKEGFNESFSDNSFELNGEKTDKDWQAKVARSEQVLSCRSVSSPSLDKPDPELKHFNKARKHSFIISAGNKNCSVGSSDEELITKDDNFDIVDAKDAEFDIADAQEPLQSMTKSNRVRHFVKLDNLELPEEDVISHSETDIVDERLPVLHHKERLVAVRSSLKKSRQYIAEENGKENISQETNCWSNAELILNEGLHQSTSAVDSGPTLVPRERQRNKKRRRNEVEKSSEVESGDKFVMQEQSEFSETNDMSNKEEKNGVFASEILSNTNFERASKKRRRTSIRENSTADLANKELPETSDQRISEQTNSKTNGSGKKTRKVLQRNAKGCFTAKILTEEEPAADVSIRSLPAPNRNDITNFVADGCNSKSGYHEESNNHDQKMHDDAPSFEVNKPEKGFYYEFRSAPCVEEASTTVAQVEKSKLHSEASVADEHRETVSFCPQLTIEQQSLPDSENCSDVDMDTSVSKRKDKPKKPNSTIILHENKETHLTRMVKGSTSSKIANHRICRNEEHGHLGQYDIAVQKRREKRQNVAPIAENSKIVISHRILQKAIDQILPLRHRAVVNDKEVRQVLHEDSSESSFMGKVAPVPSCKPRDKIYNTKKKHQKFESVPVQISSERGQSHSHLLRLNDGLQLHLKKNNKNSIRSVEDNDESSNEDSIQNSLTAVDDNDDTPQWKSCITVEDNRSATKMKNEKSCSKSDIVSEHDYLADRPMKKNQQELINLNANLNKSFARDSPISNLSLLSVSALNRLCALCARDLCLGKSPKELANTSVENCWLNAELMEQAITDVTSATKHNSNSKRKGRNALSALKSIMCQDFVKMQLNFDCIEASVNGDVSEQSLSRQTRGDDSAEEDAFSGANVMLKSDEVSKTGQKTCITVAAKASPKLSGITSTPNSVSENNAWVRVKQKNRDGSSKLGMNPTKRPNSNGRTKRKKKRNSGNARKSQNLDTSITCAVGQNDFSIGVATFQDMSDLCTGRISRDTKKNGKRNKIRKDVQAFHYNSGLSGVQMKERNSDLIPFGLERFSSTSEEGGNDSNSVVILTESSLAKVHEHSEVVKRHSDEDNSLMKTRKKKVKMKSADKIVSPSGCFYIDTMPSKSSCSNWHKKSEQGKLKSQHAPCQSVSPDSSRNETRLLSDGTNSSTVDAKSSKKRRKLYCQTDNCLLDSSPVNNQFMLGSGFGSAVSNLITKKTKRKKKS